MSDCTLIKNIFINKLVLANLFYRAPKNLLDYNYYDAKMKAKV